MKFCLQILLFVLFFFACQEKKETAVLSQIPEPESDSRPKIGGNDSENCTKRIYLRRAGRK